MFLLTMDSDEGTVQSVPDFGYATWGGTGLPTDPGGGDTDQSAVLASWLNAVGDGTATNRQIVRFPYRRCVRVDKDVVVTNKDYWTVDYNGCWFVRTAEQADDGIGAHEVGYPVFDWQGGSNQIHKNGYARGSNRTTAVGDAVLPQFGDDAANFRSAWTATTEANHGWRFQGIATLRAENLEVRDTWGDGFTVGGEHDSDKVSNYVVYSCRVYGCGRHAITLGSCDGTNVVDYCDLLYAFGLSTDPEVNGTMPGGTNNVEVRFCTMFARNGIISAGSQGHTNLYYHHNTILATNRAQPLWSLDNGPISGLRIEDNVYQGIVSSPARDAWAMVLANASGTNSFRRNVVLADNSDTSSAIYLGQPGRPVSGTLQVDGNDLQHYDSGGLYTDNVISGLTKSPNCGNRLVLGGAFDQPTAC